MTRDRKGRFMRKPWVLNAIVIVCALLFAAYYVSAPEVYQAPEVVERDGIQKLTDTLAEAYRVLQKAEAQYAEASSTLQRARDAYDTAVWQVNTFTK